MKKLNSITLILVSLISSMLILIHFDKDQQKSLLLLDIKTYNYSVSIENYDEITFNSETRAIVDNLALDHNVNLLVSHFRDQDNTVKFLFSGNTKGIIQDKLNISSKEFSPYSTTGELANVDDILRNDPFIYDVLSGENDSNFYWDGTFYISFDSIQDYDMFISDFSQKFSIPSESINYTTRGYRETGQLLSIVLGSSSVILFILFILTIIQRINAHATRIGVLLLNGYDNVGVLKVLFGSDYKIVIITSLITCIGYFLLPDIPNKIILTSFFKDLVIIAIIYTFYFFFVRIILKTKSIVSLLKNSRISSKLSQINMYIQIIVSTIILLIFLFMSNNIRTTFTNYNDMRKYDYLMNYGTIYKINHDFFQNHSDSSQEIFKKIMGDSFLKDRYIYANFDKYNIYQEDVIVQVGYDYDDLYATISNNYLSQDNITIYDDANNKIETESLNTQSDIFIFPKNYSKDISKLLNYYYSNNLDIYENPDDFKPTTLFYDDTSLKTYNVEILEIDSPVLKIIRTDEYRSYTNHPEGLSIFAIGMQTGLKFEVHADKDQVIDHLMKIFEDVGYPEAMEPSHFITISDYLNADLARNYNTIKIMSLGIGVITLLLFFSQFQFVSLYMVQNEREISVKRYLGFENRDIYKELFKIGILQFLISLILAIGLNFLINIGDWLIFGMSALVFCLFNSFSMMFIIKITSKNKLSKSLKGGNG